MKHIPSYPSIYALGHRAIAEILSSPCVIEEKVDGSQFSMCRTDGELSCRSKGKDIILDNPEKMFSKAVATAQALDLRDGWTYRCEYLASPKHNTLAYSRVPKMHLVVFDICTGPESYLNPTEKRSECERIGLECVPCFFDGIARPHDWQNGEQIDRAWIEDRLSQDSFLGGCKIEGIVVKNYAVFTPEKKVAIAKYVSEAFKEKHTTEWKKSNPTQSDVAQHIITSLKTEARWRKAIQHLRDDGRLTETPRDIGAFIAEIQADVEKEETDGIKEALFKHFWPQIKRGVIAGAPEFYKEQLLNKALERQGHE